MSASNDGRSAVLERDEEQPWARTRLRDREPPPLLTPSVPSKYALVRAERCADGSYVATDGSGRQWPSSEAYAAWVRAQKTSLPSSLSGHGGRAAFESAARSTVAPRRAGHPRPADTAHGEEGTR